MHTLACKMGEVQRVPNQPCKLHHKLHSKLETLKRTGIAKRICGGFFDRDSIRRTLMNSHLGHGAHGMAPSRAFSGLGLNLSVPSREEKDIILIIYSLIPY